VSEPLKSGGGTIDGQTQTAIQSLRGLIQTPLVYEVLMGGAVGQTLNLMDKGSNLVAATSG
jgi:hypothetical protein